MCGICAFIGYEDGYKYLIFAIKMLQNRGYDSAGIGAILNKQFVIRKYASTDTCFAVDRLMDLDNIFRGSSNCMAHTRWRTHGSKCDINSHPHMDYTNKFSIVHNGIIENYAPLKNELINNGVKFKSETDTEVIVNLIGYYYKEVGSAEDAIQKALFRLEGTWGLVILCTDEPNKLFCARHGSPLLIGFGEGDSYMMVASEQSGFCKYVNNYICLNDDDLVVLEKKDNKVVFHKVHEYDIRKITAKVTAISPDPYPHWTIKEIYEQYDVSLRAMGMGGRIKDDRSVRLGGLEQHTNDLLKLDHLIILGCGTSYNAGMYAMDIFKKISGFNTVQIFDGAKFTKYDIPKKGKTGLILISQSGETKDLHRCVSLGKDNDLFMIGVINVVDSLIAREVDCGVYTNASKEVGVASTKVFTSQVIVLYLIGIWFSQHRGICENKRIRIISDLRRLPLDIKTIINQNSDKIMEVAKYLQNRNSLFVIGKGTCEAIAQESALKIKEIGYIHAESYASSSLKHGPYSLIINKIPVIVIIPDDKQFSKNCGVIEEISGRDAFVIGISDHNLQNHLNKCNIKIKVPKNTTFVGLLSVMPSQLIAYHLATIKGHNPDFPRNLAKSVTTD